MRRTLTALIVVLLLAGLGAGAWFYRRLFQPYKGYQGADQFVAIPAGTSSRAIADTLVRAGVVRDALTFQLALRVEGAAHRLQAGEYRFEGPLTPIEVVRQLAEGRVYLRPITFPEGLSAREMASLFERQGFGPAAAFEAAARNAALIRDLDPEATHLEGFLFPDTYALPRSATADQLVAGMVARFKQVFDQPMRQVAASRGLRVREVVTLASLVEKETGRPEERALVAAVYVNRLQAGMALQCDPTVIYALEQAGKYDGNLDKAGLAFDSPYNTYRYRGLPPGPIASPGRASLVAALAPAPVDYLYLVSRNDGTHVFARTLAEHQKNVFRYQVQFFRQKRLNQPKKR